MRIELAGSGQRVEEAPGALHQGGERREQEDHVEADMPEQVDAVELLILVLQKHLRSRIAGGWGVGEQGKVGLLSREQSTGSVHSAHSGRDAIGREAQESYLLQNGLKGTKNSRKRSEHEA